MSEHEDLVERARRGNFDGMNFAVLARMSDESRRIKHLKSSGVDDETAKSAPKRGIDINNRDEQVEQCVRRVEAGGGAVVYIYDEPDTSAWKRRKVTLEDGTEAWRVVRPVYKKALSDLTKGVVEATGVRFDGLIIQDVDRLTRDNRDLEDAIDTVVHSERPIIDRRGALDLLTSHGRTMARVIVSFKSGQSSDTAWRVENKNAALQREGIPTGGARPFGWMEDKRTLHTTEAKLLQKAVEDILSGRSMTALVADWGERGILTPQGHPWKISTLKATLQNPRMAGYRMKTVQVKGEDGKSRRRTVIARDEDGNPVIGQWKRMITPEEWDRLKAIIGAAPGRGDGHNTRKYLGTGTLRCGKDGCDTKLRAVKTTAKEGGREGHFTYACPSKSQGGCGGLKIDGPATDKVLIKLAIAKYELESSARNATAVPEQWSQQADLDRVLENKAAAKAARNAGTISAELYYADLGQYEAQERALIKSRNAFMKASAQASELPVDLRTQWLDGHLTLTEQRSYIERALSAVIVAPAGGRRKVPARDRLTPIPAA